MHFSRESLAENANLSVRFIGHIETGRKRASVDTLIGIADALGITVDLLLLGNCDSEIIGHVCEFAELIIDRDDDDRDAILDAAIAIAVSLHNES
jgi:transcriptional regulator with XRE-family HTH domain